MILQRWNWEKHQYNLFIVPDERRVILFTPDMNAIIDCTNCGKEITYGKSFTSRSIHNQLGLGYPVCEGCYCDDWEAYEKAKENELP